MGELASLERTVGILRDEMLRLSQAVSRLEAHAAGRTVQVRDAALTAAGILVSAACLVWIFKAFGV